MAKTFKIVHNIDPTVFETDCTTKLNSGYTPVGGTSKYGENAREYIQAFENAGTNTPRIGIANAQIVLDFGNVEAGAVGVSVDLGIIGQYITGNILPTLTGLNSDLFTLTGGGAPIAPDGDGNINTTRAINFTPPALTVLGAKEAYITLTTDGGQTVNVIVKGTVI